jgi:alpha/beta superfamily hydrolase
VTDQLLSTTQAKSICAVGYSFGAAVALAAADDPRIEKLVLVAPPTAIADFSALARLRKPLLAVCAHHDSYCDRAALQLPDGALLEVVPHADHFFKRGLTEMGKAVAAFLRGDRPEFVAPPDPPDEAVPEQHRDVDLDPGDGEPLELDGDPPA